MCGGGGGGGRGVVEVGGRPVDRRAPASLGAGVGRTSLAHGDTGGEHVGMLLVTAPAGRPARVGATLGVLVLAQSYCNNKH